MSTKIKLVHIISSMQQGGAENLLVQLIAHMGSEVYEHHVIYFHNGPCSDAITDVRVTKYHIIGVLCLYDPVWWYRILSLVRSLRPDIIHTHLWAAHVVGRLCAKFFSIPVVATYHTPLLEDDGDIRKQIDRLTMRYETFSCAVSTPVQATWNSLVPKSSMRWQTISNGVDIERFDQARADSTVTRASLGIPADAIVFGGVGRFVQSKRYDTLIDACALVARSYGQTYLLILGWGDQEERLRERVKSRGIEERVRFVVGKQAAPYYKLMDVFMLPSEREGMSMALLEAMVNSLPVIIVHHADTPHDVVTDGQEGVVLSTNLPSTLASAMIHMILFPEHVVQYKKNARATIERGFSFQAMQSRYEALYQSIKRDR